MTYHTIRTPDQIRQDAAHKLRHAQLGDDFLAILGCLLGEQWTKPRLVEMRITSEGIALARPEDQDHFATCLGMSVDLLKSIHGLPQAADLDGDEVGYLVAKVAEIKQQR